MKRGYIFLWYIFSVFNFSACIGMIESPDWIYIEIHQYASDGNLSKLKMRLSQEDSVNKRGPSGWTALHRAVQGGHIHIVRWLISQGADVNAKSEWGDTPLTETFDKYGPDGDKNRIKILIS